MRHSTKRKHIEPNRNLGAKDLMTELKKKKKKKSIVCFTSKPEKAGRNH